MMESISDKLDKLYDLRASARDLQNEFERRLRDLLPPDEFSIYIEAKRAIEAEELDLSEKIAGLERDIKSAFTAGSETVNGKTLQIYWKSGNSSWDTKKLLELSTKVPEILNYRQIGKASSSIREIPTGKQKG